MAAANPIGGRYDRSKSLKLNIDMTAPIMSRFDLFFILVDDCNEMTDYAIARRIIDLHTKLEESIDRSYTVEKITRYEAFPLNKHLLIWFSRPGISISPGCSSRSCPTTLRNCWCNSTNISDRETRAALPRAPGGSPSGSWRACSGSARPSRGSTARRR